MILFLWIVHVSTDANTGEVNGATAYDQYNTSIHHSHELSVFLEEILWYDHDVLIVFMLTWSPNVSPPPILSNLH